MEMLYHGTLELDSNLFNGWLDIHVDSNRKCTHFIDFFNHMMSNFGHLNPESVVTLFKSYCCFFLWLISMEI